VRVIVCFSLGLLACVSFAPQAFAVDEALPVSTEISPTQISPTQISPFAIEDEAAPPPPRKTTKSATDPFEPPGLRLGTFTIKPELEISTIATTNARSTVTGEPDLGIFLKPSLGWQSDWPRHSWSGKLDGDITRYADDTELRADALNAESDLKIEIRRETFLDVKASYKLDYNSNDDTGAAASDSSFDQDINVSLALRKELGRIQTRTTLGIARNITGDTDAEDNSDLNRTDPSLGLRVGYKSGGAFTPFIGMAYTPRFFDETVDRDGLRRNSQGFTGEIGTEIAAEPFWTGEVAMTYGFRNFEDATLSNESSLGLNAAITWAPTELTKVVFDVDGKLRNGVDALREFNAEVSLTHDLRDNLEVFGNLAAEIEREDGDTDVTYSAGSGVKWKINPYLAWQLSYEGVWFKSGASSAGNYTDHSVLTSIILRR
jgi:hypothetical protein